MKKSCREYIWDMCFPILNFKGTYNCNYRVTSIPKAVVVFHNYLM